MRKSSLAGKEGVRVNDIWHAAATAAPEGLVPYRLSRLGSQPANLGESVLLSVL